MLFPTQSLAYMETSDCGGGNHADACVVSSQIPGLYASLCSDPLSNLFVLEDASLTEVTAPHASAFLHTFLTERVPPLVLSTRTDRLVSYHDAPLRILAWRLDSPARAIVYTGSQPPTPSQMAPGSLQPHTLQKVQVSQRSKRPSPCAILFGSVSNDIRGDSVSNDIRGSLSLYVRSTSSLAPYQETLTVAGKPFKAQSHTLEEAMVCLLYPPLLGNHTEVPLNCSLAWSKNQIDARCVFLIGSLAEMGHLGEQQLLARPLGVHIGQELAARRMGLHSVQHAVRVG
jgi:hypothetical protein